MKAMWADIRCTALGLLLMTGCRGDAPMLSVRGYPADLLDSLRVREAVLRDTPDTAQVNEYARIMSEEPNHAGSPGARAIAEWALGKFREWRFDAEIEEFEALLPTPTLRRVDLVSPRASSRRCRSPRCPTTTAGMYHSIYDSYDNFTRFIDPGFT